MANHPNRNTRGETVRAAPSPDEIRTARESVEVKHPETGEMVWLTQTQAAESIYSTLRAWQDWESGARKMHPALFELFQLKHGLVSIRDVKKGG